MTKVWILTEEHNDYDQYGAYFVAVFANKPTKEQLKKYDILDEEVEHVLAGGGRGNEWANVWYWLTEIELE